MRKTVIGITLATLLSSPSLGEERAFPAYPSWGDGYYAGMKMDDAQFEQYKEEIMNDLRSTYKGDRMSDGIWTFHSIRNWKKERYEANKEGLWQILLSTKKGGTFYPQSPSLCEQAIKYLPDDRILGYQSRVQECALRDLELVVRNAPEWPEKRFLAAREAIMKGMTKDRRKGSHLAYLAGIYWDDQTFFAVKDQLVAILKKSRKAYRTAKRMWKPERLEYLK